MQKLQLGPLFSSTILISRLCGLALAHDLKVDQQKEGGGGGGRRAAVKAPDSRVLVVEDAGEGVPKGKGKAGKDGENGKGGAPLGGPNVFVCLLVI